MSYAVVVEKMSYALKMSYAVVVEVTLDGKGWFSVDRVVVAGDQSFLVNPDTAEAQVEGSVVFGLTCRLLNRVPKACDH